MGSPCPTQKVLDFFADGNGAFETLGYYALFTTSELLLHNTNHKNIVASLLYLFNTLTYTR